MRLIGAGMQERMKKEQADKVKNYRILNAYAKKGGILFTGSSLMEQFPICELAMDAGITLPVYNRGIGGTTTDDFLREIDTVLLNLEPSRVFLNIGTNDMTDPDRRTRDPAYPPIRQAPCCGQGSEPCFRQG